MACILLFMRGGPSQFETFDPKPGTANGGPTKAIDTAVTGIQIAEDWPQRRQAMKDIALIRSMTNKEGEHQRADLPAAHRLRPGRRRQASRASAPSSPARSAPADFDLPHFVSIGNRLGDDRLRLPRHAATPRSSSPTRPSCRPTSRCPAASTTSASGAASTCCNDLEQDFAEAGGAAPRRGPPGPLRQRRADGPQPAAEGVRPQPGEGRRSATATAATPFGQGCLLARRLVEAGVTFVEVALQRLGHAPGQLQPRQDAERAGRPGFAALVADLKERGLLDRTLVIWMGEFGRTPHINPNTGRDHFPRAFNVALAGGGIKGGQVIGATSADGTDVTRPAGHASPTCSAPSATR